MTMRVLDTNIVLDLWVFDDPAAAVLRESLQDGGTQWVATSAMREELVRVLDYPHIARRLTARAMTADTVLGHFDRYAQLQPEAPKAPYTCKDADDQKFIDLAVQHGAALHSKDAQVLCMKNRLARCGVVLNPVLDGRGPAALAMTSATAAMASSDAASESTPAVTASSNAVTHSTPAVTASSNAATYSTPAVTARSAATRQSTTLTKEITS